MAADDTPRFEIQFSDEDLDHIIKEKDSKQTQTVIKASVNMFTRYLEERHPQQLHLMELTADSPEADVTALVKILRSYYAETRKKNGDMYTRKSMVTMRYGLQRHFLTRNVDILKLPAFKPANEMFSAILVKLKTEGLGVVVHKNPISQEDMKKLYLSEALSLDTPSGLQNKVFVDFMLYFANRGRENLRDMKTNDFVFHTDANGKKYATIKDKLTKNDRGETSDTNKSPRMYEVAGSPLCPVASLEKYLNSLHSDSDLFWQRPKKTSKDDTWYDNCPLGKNTIGGKMKALSTAASLSKEYTNHCLRATCVTTLSNLGFDARQIMAVTGHKSESSLKHYTKVGSPQKKKISEALSTFVNSTEEVSDPVQEEISDEPTMPLDLNDFEVTASQEAVINQSFQQTTSSNFLFTNCTVNIYRN